MYDAFYKTKKCQKTQTFSGLNEKIGHDTK